MAQITTGYPGQHDAALTAESLAVACPAAGNTELLNLPVSGLSRIAVQVDVTVQALDAFIIQIKLHPSAAFQTLFSAASDYTSPNGLLVGASGNLTAQAAASSGWFIMDVAGLHAVKVLASGAVDGCLVSARANGA